MSTKASELVASVTVDTRGAVAGLATVQGGMAKLATGSQKAAHAIAGGADAFADLQRRGGAALGDLTTQAASLASVFGPTGAIVGAAAVATVAIVAIFTRTKREIGELRTAFDRELRELERSGNSAALVKRQQQLFSGDRLFGDPNSEEEKSNKALARFNQAVRDGGVIGLDKRIGELSAKLIELEAAKQRAFADQAGGAAIEAYNRQIFTGRRRVDELIETQRLLKAEYAQVAPVATAATAADVERTDTVRRLNAAEEARTKSLSERKRQEEELLALGKQAETLLDSLNKVGSAQRGETALQQMIDRYERAGVPVRKLQLQLAELRGEVDAQGNNTPETVRQIDEIRGAYGKYLDDVNDLARAIDEAGAAERTDKSKAITKTLGDVGAQIDTNNERYVQQREKLDALDRSRRQTVESLEAEARALETGSAAYREFVKAQAIAAQQAEDATAKGAPLTPTELTASAAKAIALFDRAEAAQQRIAAAAAKGISPLVQQFSDIAESAVQIAAALGESGEGLGKGAGILLGVLKGLSGLQEATVKRDAKGEIVRGAKGVPETVGVFAALRGRNGNAASSAASQAAALGSIVSITGAVLGIADALDLFGTRAKQQREELRQRAEEFNQALGAFARSVAERGIGEFAAARNQLASELGELAGRGAAAAGLSIGSGTRFSADGLRQYEAQLRTQADTILRSLRGKRGEEVGAGLEQAAKLSAFADKIREIGEQAAVAEAALAAQQAAAVKVASEDLEVRRLTALGFTEEAEARRVALEQQRALEAALTDFAGAEGYQEYLRALREVQAAELAAAAATAARARVLRELDLSLDILGGSAAEKLQSTVAALGTLFPQFASLFEGLDSSTREGLEAARERLREQFRALSADGITDAEQPIVDAIRQLLGGIEGALQALPDTVAQALEAFAVRTEVFGLSLAQQFDGLAAIFAEQFPQLADLLGEAFPTDDAGRSALRTRLQDAIGAILDDGVITDAEAPFLEALRSFLGLVNGAIDDAAAALETARQTRVSAAARGVRGALAFGDLSDADALRTRARSAASLSPIFAPLLDLFDDTSVDGITRSRDALYQLFRDIEAGRIPLEEFGDLTEEEIIERILELNGTLDGLGDALRDAARAAEEAAAAERQQTTDLRVRLNRSRGLDTRLEEFENAARAEREAAVAAGRSASFLAFLDQVLASERTKLVNDIAGAATTAAIEAQASAAAAQSAGRNNVGRVLGGVTDVSVQVQNGYLRLIADHTRATAQYSAALLSVLGGLRPVTPIQAPALPGVGGAGNGAAGASLAGASFTIHVGTPVINTTNLSGSPSEVGTQIGTAQAKAIEAELSRLLGLGVRAIGGRIR